MPLVAIAPIHEWITLPSSPLDEMCVHCRLLASARKFDEAIYSVDGGATWRDGLPPTVCSRYWQGTT